MFANPARPPVVMRGTIRVASWIVPKLARSAWRARWESGLENWWVLVERGELISGATAQIARTIRVAFKDAFWLRFNKAYLEYWVRGPACLMACAGVALLLIAALTSGFRITRALIDIAVGHPGPRILSFEGPAGTLIVYTLPIVFALAAGAVLVAIGRLSVHGYGCRYWSFLAAKTIFVMVFISLLWIEGGTAIRRLMPEGYTRVLVGGIGLTVAFVFGFACALDWSFDDQRRRCPVCLRLLTMPVTVGSWASVFEPAVTELLCDEGHGRLCLSENETGQPDRWTALDASWRDLFETSRAAIRPRN
jgi:hypothetical protein